MGGSGGLAGIKKQLLEDDDKDDYDYGNVIPGQKKTKQKTKKFAQQ